MHPAPSLIVFTSTSGMGLGLIAVIGLGLLPHSSVLWVIISHGLAVGLVSIGLLASLFHLGHPERAWRALSQWRSSWLSREGVLAIITLCLTVVLTATTLFKPDFSAPSWLGIITAVSALATIWATAMIYASLKTVSRWHHPLTPIVFTAYGVSGGFVLASALASIAGGSGGLTLYAIISLLCTMGVAGLWGRLAGRQGSGSSVESATGLASSIIGGGDVRLLMPPHSEQNWLQHEMGFVVARKHAHRLTAIGILLSAILPLILFITLPQSVVGGIFATILHLGGVMVSRWLFFAEAKHVVTLYYGDRH